MCSVLGLILVRPVVSSRISSLGFRASVHHVRGSLTSVGTLTGSLVIVRLHPSWASPH